ncbi:MAG: ATP-binding protein [Spirochaetaceae bacterium]|nr:ATP-binding protein [Spirochaetaceae bacterium]
MSRRLPIGIQDFISIREEGFCYVDKTAHIHRLITGSGRAFFLSRPRRFGKSLLCSTLGAVFQGRRDLFGEIAGQSALAIDSLEWGWERYPVIRLDLNPGNYTNGITVLYDNLSRDMEFCAETYGMPFEGESIGDRFARLIYALHKQYNQRVVVIIDEYDKPLLATIDAPELHVQMRDELKGFYGILKSYDKYLQFVLLTGVTKFSHVSIFSDLNHLVDLTLDPRYADLCGITQKEVEDNFEPEISAILENTGKSRDIYLGELKRFYNGYRFTRKSLTVYNPFGLLNHFDKSGEFLSYWYGTGTPTFLVNLIIKQKVNILGLHDMHIRYEDFSKYDIETMKVEPLLYQTGYVTIADYDEELEQFILDYPNEEVKSSFSKALLEQYTHSSDEQSRSLYAQLPISLIKGEPEKVLETLRVFFASIPYDLIQNKENYYQTAIHLIFNMFGLNCRSEVRIAAGRIDTLVETKRYVYCFEFKLDGSVEEALAQIDTKEYLLPWKGDGKQLFKVGVVFDSKKRTIGEWKIA